MKKILTYLITTTLMLGCLSTSALAQQNSESETRNGFDSNEQYEQIPDYYSSERVAAREAKLRDVYNVKENMNHRSGSKYTINLPLRGQQKTDWCAAAVIEMITDYQLGTPNKWTQTKIFNDMNGKPNASNIAATLRRSTGQSYEAQKISQLPLMTALKKDINSYAGLALLVEASYLYTGFKSWHALAAKGYSSNTVIYLDPWKYNPSIYGQHEVSINTMTSAIKGAEGIYVW